MDLAGHAHHALLPEGVLRLAQKLKSAHSTNKNAPKYYDSFEKTSGYATWGAIRIARYDVIDDVITGKL